MSIISMVLVVFVAFLAGLEGILDQFQFHQPLVACTLIGLVTGNLTAGVILGGSLQMIALGWANIGAAVAPDAALASVAAAIIMVQGGDFTDKGITVATTNRDSSCRSWSLPYYDCAYYLCCLGSRCRLCC